MDTTIARAAEVSTARRGVLGSISAAFSAGVGAVAGIAAHVLHHVGPIAGAALVSGFGGTALFGAIGFALTAPMLWRLKRRSGTWLAPAIALAIFAVVFTISTVWIGPAIRGESGGSSGQPVDHASHHE